QSPHTYTFRSLDDFHPDALLQSAPFAPLKAMRDQLDTPQGIAEALQVLTGGETGETVPATATPAAPAQDETDASTLERLLGAPSGTAATPRDRAKQMVEALIQRSATPPPAPSLADDTRANAAREAIEREMATRLRSLLRTDAIQSLEALWRMTFEFATEVDFGEDELKCSLLPISGTALADDLGEAAASGVPGRIATLLEQARGEDQALLVVATFTVGDDERALGWLAQLATVVANLEGTLLADAAPSLAGVTDTADLNTPEKWAAPAEGAAQAWRRLQDSPAAKHLALALPGLLVRLPYGERGEACESLAFEEFDGDPANGAPWGSAALGLAKALAEHWVADEANGRAPGALVLEDRPAFSYESDGERRLLPVTRTLLSDRAADALMARGLVAWCAQANGNRARLATLESVAGGALRGVWA
ncbi:MAG: type VI secretion system contractile sheath large subunit, partial [Pseudomonadota bacterium]